MANLGENILVQKGKEKIKTKTKNYLGRSSIWKSSKKLSNPFIFVPCSFSTQTESLASSPHDSVIVGEWTP